MVYEIQSASDFAAQLRQPKQPVLVYFGATWCGPCRFFAPQYEQLAAEHPDAHFCKCYDEVADVVRSESVRAFPTTKFYVNGECKGEVVGANVAEVRSTLERLAQAVPKAFAGDGATLGGGGAQALTPAQAREARLKRFGAPAGAAPAGGSDGGPPGEVVCKDGVCRVVPSGPRITLGGDAGAATMDVAAAEEEDEAALAAAVAMSMEGDAGGAKAAEEGADGAADAAASLEEAELAGGVGAQLLEMGFSEVRSRKALRTAGGNLDACIEWIMAHQDDADIDDESTMPPAPVPKAELTAEQRAEQREMLKRRLQDRREERAAAEKADNVTREAERRRTGQEMAMRREEMERMARRREAEQRRKEKMDAKRERQRILAELEKDKRERRANNGKLQTRLGVEGYNPSAIQYDQKAEEESSAKDEAPPAAAAPAPRTPGIMPNALQIVDKSIETLSQYRAGGDGGKALDLLARIVRNLVENPQEPKFERLNMEGKAYRSKIRGLVGGLRLMQAVGFVKRDVDGAPCLVLETRDMDLLRSTLARLEQGHAAYLQL